MKIVIDIPNGAYEELCNGQFPVQDAYRIVAWIKDGTPLPEGADGKKDGIGWILVTERLPEESGLYLCSIKAYDTNNYVLLGRFSMNRFNLIDVEAWMPLPKPYEEGAE